jgi:phosphatidylglycerol lysyltransferase
MKRSWILILLTVLFIWVIVSRFTEIEQLRATLAQANWGWVLIALLSQIVYYLVFTASYQAAFYTVEIPTRLRDLVPVTLGSLFVNVVVPAGGAGGVALFADDLSKRGQSGARASAGVLLQLIADFGAFALVLIAGLFFLFTQHDLQVYEIVAALILMLATVGLALVLVLGVWRPTLLQRLFAWSQRTINHLFGKLPRSFTLASDWAEKNAGEFNQAAAAVASHPARLARTVLTALSAHILDILTLYIVFRAFNQPVTIGQLVAGYAICILFWIVSITPQGIGIVEGTMALVLTSLGIPGAVAATVALSFRGLTFWLPLLIGFVLIRKARVFEAQTQARTLSETWSVRILAILVALMGVINVLSAMTPSLPQRLTFLERYSPLEVRHGGHLTAALAGFALLVLARNLWRRKRAAWLVTLLVLAFSIASHLVKGLDYEEATLAGALGILLFLQRHHFHAASDRPSVRQGLWVLAGDLIFTLAYGVTGFYLLDRHYSINFGLMAALRQTVVMFTQFYDPGLNPITGFGRYFAASIYGVGAFTTGYALLMLLRPVFIRPTSSLAQQQRAQEIVEKYGRSSLARYVVFDDKNYYFSPAGSVVGYATRGRIGVALGDPIGPAEDARAAINGFREFCIKNDWLPAFYQVLPDYLAHYKNAGFETLCVGNEAIVDLRTFTLEGKAVKDIRNAVSRMRREGFSFQIHPSPISDELLAELRTISDEWLTTMHGAEKRFSLGWFEDEYIRSCPIAAIHAADGLVIAFANIVSEFQKSEISIDLMRRRENIPNGAMDFLFASLFLWAREQGYASFDLGLSSLSGIGEHPEDPALERLLHYIYEHINQFYNFQGLHSFKEKFHPQWEPRYLIYPNQASLPVVWTALMRAHSSENFIWAYVKDWVKK